MQAQTGEGVFLVPSTASAPLLPPHRSLTPNFGSPGLIGVGFGGGGGAMLQPSAGLGVGIGAGMSSGSCSNALYRSQSSYTLSAGPAAGPPVGVLSRPCSVLGASMTPPPQSQSLQLRQQSGYSVGPGGIGAQGFGGGLQNGSGAFGTGAGVVNNHTGASGVMAINKDFIVPNFAQQQQQQSQQVQFTPHGNFLASTQQPPTFPVQLPTMAPQHSQYPAFSFSGSAAPALSSAGSQESSSASACIPVLANGEAGGNGGGGSGGGLDLSVSGSSGGGGELALGGGAFLEQASNMGSNGALNLMSSGDSGSYAGSVGDGDGLGDGFDGDGDGDDDGDGASLSGNALLMHKKRRYKEINASDGTTYNCLVCGDKALGYFALILCLWLWYSELILNPSLSH